MVKKPCPGCGSLNTHYFYEIDKVPIYSTTILDTRQSALDFPKGNIELFFCHNCGFIFNGEFQEGLLDYSIPYEDQQGFSGTFSTFLRELAKYLVEEYDLFGKTVLEIGSGKGDFLTLLYDIGKINGIGIDPAFIDDRIKDKNNKIKFIKDYYSNRYTTIKSDMICCRHTLEHISNVSSFMNNIRVSAENNLNTIVFFEIPDVTRILNEHAFWDIYYEHCSYFSPGSISKIFRLNKMNPIKIKKVYNDQYLTIEARPSLNKSDSTLGMEEDFECVKTLVNKFPEKTASKIEYWKNMLSNYKDDEIIIWGSGSKCVSFITTLNIMDKVKAVIDINPYRHGYYLPSIGHQIVKPDYLIENKPELLIIMNSIYDEEIREMIKSMGLSMKIMSLN